MRQFYTALAIYQRDFADLLNDYWSCTNERNLVTVDLHLVNSLGTCMKRVYRKIDPWLKLTDVWHVVLNHSNRAIKCDQL